MFFVEFGSLGFEISGVGASGCGFRVAGVLDSVRFETLSLVVASCPSASFCDLGCPS